MFDLLEFVSLHMQLKFFMNLKFENDVKNFGNQEKKQNV